MTKILHCTPQFCKQALHYFLAPTQSWPLTALLFAWLHCILSTLNLVFSLSIMMRLLECHREAGSRSLATKPTVVPPHCIFRHDSVGCLYLKNPSTGLDMYSTSVTDGMSAVSDISKKIQVMDSDSLAQLYSSYHNDS